MEKVYNKPVHMTPGLICSAWEYGMDKAPGRDHPAPGFKMQKKVDNITTD
jgi:hypothetical protein